MTQGDWFHVAVAYNGSEGAADNLSLYWTKVDATRTSADLLRSTTLNLDLSTAANGPDFAIGNIGRNPSQGNFLGAIDEVRISDTQRGAGDFIFVPEPGVASLALIGFLGFLGFVRRKRR